MRLEDQIRKKLEQAFAPTALEVINDSDKHIGHAGHDGSGESHFRIKMTASFFKGKSRLEQQRAVYDVLSDEMQHKIHALALNLSSEG